MYPGYFRQQEMPFNNLPLSQGPGLRNQLLAFSLQDSTLASRVPESRCLKEETSSPNWKKFGLQRPRILHGFKDFLKDICLQTIKIPENSKCISQVKANPYPHSSVRTAQNPFGLCFFLFFSYCPLPHLSYLSCIQPCNSCHYSLGRGRREDEWCGTSSLNSRVGNYAIS